MKTWLVSSAITFVPQNYDGFLRPLAQNPHVEGLIILDNRSWTFVAQALFLIVSGAAPRFGGQLLKNCLFNPIAKKKKYYESCGKKVVVLKDINAEESVAEIRNLKPDLLLNARTRAFFRKQVLELPRFGCLNIHHGLLPDQRGLMCDFWAHLFRTKAGFSIHVMTPKLDDGGLLKVVPVSSDGKNYLKFISKAAELEVQAVADLLKDLALNRQVLSLENKKSDNTVYRKNPSLRDFYKLRFSGVKI